MKHSTLLLLLFLSSLTSFCQSKKEQIIQLNFKIDSLFNNLSSLKSVTDSTTRVLNGEIYRLIIQNATINNLFDSVKYTLEKKKKELDSTKKILDSVYNSGVKFKFDTINGSQTRACYYYFSDFPYLISSPYNDSTRKYINRLIKELSFSVPAIMQNQSYKKFKECGNDYYYDKRTELNFQSEFNSKILNIEHGRYLSILMEVFYYPGGGANWGHKGLNSLNIKGDKIIIIPNNKKVKEMLISEINDYQKKTPMIESSYCGGVYQLSNQLIKWDITDLSFYFKNDTLRLIFNNGEHGLCNKNYDIPLPQLQNFLKL